MDGWEKGVDINLPRELWATAAEHQLAATAESSAEVLLSDWFAGEAPCWISPANLVLLLRVAIGREVSKNVYAPVMKRLGFANKTRRVGKGVPRVWVRGEPVPNAPGYSTSLTSSGRPVLQHLQVA